MGVRIATFNLKDFFLPRTDAERATVEAKVANIAENLRRANADVVALQEVGSPELLDRLVGNEAKDLGYASPLLGTADKRGIRVAILSRLPVLWSQVHAPKVLPFPRFLEGDVDPFDGRIPLRRGIVHARIDAGDGGEIDVMTAHFKSKLGVVLKTKDGVEIVDPTHRGRAEASVRSLVQRAAEALFVRGLVDDVIKASPDHLIAVLGDLNDGPDSVPVGIVRGTPDGGAGWLQHAHERVAPERRYSTFHGGGPSLIDHILVSEPLHRRLSGCAIQNEALRDHGPHVDDTPLTEDSDHALVVASFD
jgi:endonuclease/exonuclease/phosphatase family metal-dependent hydrolase